MLLATL